MISHQPFHYHSVQDVRDDIQRLGLNLPISDRFDVLGHSA